MEPRESGQLLPVGSALNCAKLNDWSVHLLYLFILLRVLFSDLCQKLNDALYDDLLDLLQELGVLKGLSGDVERKVVGCRR